MGSSKTRAADKWTWAGSSSDLNPRPPERQRNTEVICASRLSSPPRSTQALLPAPLGAATAQRPQTRGAGSWLQLPGGLTAGKGGLLKATFGFSFLTLLLRPAPRQSYSVGTLLRRGTYTTCLHRAGRRKNKPGASGASCRRDVHSMVHIPTRRPLRASTVAAPVSLGSNQLLVAPGARWDLVHVPRCAYPHLTVSAGAAESPAATGCFPPQHRGQ